MSYRLPKDNREWFKVYIAVIVILSSMYYMNEWVKAPVPAKAGPPYLEYLNCGDTRSPNSIYMIGGKRCAEISTQCAIHRKEVIVIDGLEIDCPAVVSWYNVQTLMIRDEKDETKKITEHK